MQYFNMTMIILASVASGFLVVPCSEFFINRRKAASNFLSMKKLYIVIICVVLNSAGSLAAYAIHDLSYGQALISVLIWLSLVISVIDLKIRMIPNELTLMFIVIALAFHFAIGDGITLASHIIGMACGFGLFLLGDILTGGGKVGAGDIKLAGAIGFITGFPGVLPTLLVASVSVSLICGYMMLKGFIKRETPVPYAPFITAGLITAVALKDTVSFLWLARFITI